MLWERVYWVTMHPPVTLTISFIYVLLMETLWFEMSSISSAGLTQSTPLDMAHETLQDYVLLKASQPNLLCHGDLKIENIIINDHTSKPKHFSPCLIIWLQICHHISFETWLEITLHLHVWQNQPLGGSTSLVSACSMSASGKCLWLMALEFRTRVPGVWGSIPSRVDPMTHEYMYHTVHSVRKIQF